jgi:serine/threonine protein kinase
MAVRVLNDRYEVQKQLGKKAKQLTLLGRDLQMDRLVVIKILGLDVSEANSIVRYEREMAVLKSLSHPAIPLYIDSFRYQLRNAEGFAIVQSYVPARCLGEFLRQGRLFTEPEAKQIARQVLDALVYLHGLSPPIMHRNIKPSNVLVELTPDNKLGQTSLIDFGSIQAAATLDDSSSKIMASYEYTAPEHFAGNPVFASDLYSLGTTLISALTGTYISELPRKGARIQFEDAVMLSTEFADWLKRMTDPNLLTRLPSAQIALMTVAMM